MKSPKKQSDLSIFFSYFRPHRKLFALDMSCAALAALIDLVFPYVSRLSMERLLPERLYTAFFTLMAIVFAAYVLRAGMYYLITVLGHRMGVFIEADMRHDVFRHMQKLSFSFFDRNRTNGDAVSYDIVKRLVEGSFDGSALHYGIAEDAFYIADDAGNVSDDIRQKIEESIEMIKEGKFTVPYDNLTYQTFINGGEEQPVDDEGIINTDPEMDIQ